MLRPLGLSVVIASFLVGTGCAWPTPSTSGGSSEASSAPITQTPPGLAVACTGLRKAMLQIREDKSIPPRRKQGRMYGLAVELVLEDSDAVARLAEVVAVEGDKSAWFRARALDEVSRKQCAPFLGQSRPG